VLDENGNGSDRAAHWPELGLEPWLVEGITSRILGKERLMVHGALAPRKIPVRAGRRIIVFGR
jgi:hypothetical protein